MSIPSTHIVILQLSCYAKLQKNMEDNAEEIVLVEASESKTVEEEEINVVDVTCGSDDAVTTVKNYLGNSIYNSDNDSSSTSSSSSVISVVNNNINNEYVNESIGIDSISDSDSHNTTVESKCDVQRYFIQFFFTCL